MLSRNLSSRKLAHAKEKVLIVEVMKIFEMKATMPRAHRRVH